MAPRLVFITGTDTGVGKTLLTGLLLAHLRQTGRQAFALKLFCSGSRADARLLHALQNGELSLDEINPFFFPEPLAPLIAARKRRRRITLQETLTYVRRIAARISSLHRSTAPSLHSGDACPILLLEGAGGLLTPLGEQFNALDLIRRLRCETIIVSRNQLGTINHTLLTVAVAGIKAGLRCGPSLRLTPEPPPAKIVLMNVRRPGPSASSNPRLLSELVTPLPVCPMPFLGLHCRTATAIRAGAARVRRTLNRLV